MYTALTYATAALGYQYIYTVGNATSECIAAWEKYKQACVRDYKGTLGLSRSPQSWQAILARYTTALAQVLTNTSEEAQAEFAAAYNPLPQEKKTQLSLALALYGGYATLAERLKRENPPAFAKACEEAGLLADPKDKGKQSEGVLADPKATKQEQLCPILSEAERIECKALLERSLQARRDQIGNVLPTVHEDSSYTTQELQRPGSC